MSFVTRSRQATCRYTGPRLDPLERETRYIFVTCAPAHTDQHSAEHAAILSAMPGMHASTARAAAPLIAAPAPYYDESVDVVCGRCSQDEPQHVSDGEVFMENNERRNVMVIMTPRLADASLRSANALGLSRSAWVRLLIERALAGGDARE